MLEPEDSDGWQTCGVESTQGHAGYANISEMLAGTLVEQIEMKEHGFVQDERDPCLFVNAELGVCIGVHVDDVLAVN